MTIQDLYSIPRWVYWRLETRAGTKKPTKVPYAVRGGYKASSTNTNDWTTRPDTVPHGYNGCGFMLGDGFVGIDIDGCINVETGEVADYALRIVEMLDSYTEVSASGTGLHIIARGTVGEDRRKRKGSIEIYSASRYFTISEAIFSGRDSINERTNEINAVVDEFLTDKKPVKPVSKPTEGRKSALGYVSSFGSKMLSDDDIISIVRKSKQANKFNALWQGNISAYQSNSEADIALADILSFYTKDESQIERIMRSSGLLREKWDRNKGYLHTTISNALGTVTEQFESKQATVSVDLSGLQGEQSHEMVEANGMQIAPFWLMSVSGKKNVLTIGADAFLQFLSAQGFCKTYIAGQESSGYDFIQAQGKVLRVVSPSMIKDYVLKLISAMSDIVPCPCDNGGETEIASSELRRAVVRSHKTLFIQGFLEFLPARTFTMLNDTRDTAYVLYRNCIAVITQDGTTTMKYSDLQAYVWADAVRADEFHAVPVRTDSVFRRFVHNVCTPRGGQCNEAKYESLASAIGFMLHRYKNPAIAKAVFLTDEVISDTPEGRTGKGMICKALAFMRSSVRLDGKSFSFDSDFAYQQIDHSTSIVEFNDLNKRFRFENLYSVITDDWTVNRKGRPAFRLRFEESPKVILSANFAIDALGGSAQARLIQIELSDYYSADFTPIHEFGVMFWSGWGDDEQQQFLSYMHGCISFYLSEGVINYTPANLREKTITRFTHESFVEFMESELVFGEWLDNKLFYKLFTDEHWTGGAKDFPSAQKFSAWLKVFCRAMGYSITHKREAKTRLFLVSKNE
jgi:hypothetical protein